MAKAAKKPSKLEKAVVEKAPRARRTPEEARLLILDAADRVFSTHLPDVVGLKDVAREAGVSHALITHYFGTYDALVEATLERRFERVREQLLPTIVELMTREEDASAMLRAHREAIGRAASEPAAVRLATWAAMSGRSNADDFFTHRIQGLKLLTDALQLRSPAPREDLEFLLVVSFAMKAIWQLAGRALAGSLGRKASREMEADFDQRTDALIDTYLRAVEKKAKR